MSTRVLLGLLLLLSLLLSCQAKRETGKDKPSVSSLPTCDCKHTFDSVTAFVCRNYIGYTFRISDHATKTKLDSVTKSITVQIEAMGESEQPDCLKYMNQWLQFFNDPHLNVQIRESIDADLLRQFFAKSPKTEWSETEANQYFLKNKNSLDPVEGVWQAYEHRIAIRKKYQNPDLTLYEGITLQGDSVYWMPGQIKMIIEKKKGQPYTGYYFDNDHVKSPVRFQVTDSRLMVSGFTTWYRLPGKPPAETDDAALYAVDYHEPDPKTIVIKIPGFDFQAQQEIDSIVKLHRKRILQSDLLILDLRNNFGGGPASFAYLMPFLYTQPFVIKGIGRIPTQETIDDYSRLLKQAIDAGYVDSSMQVLLKNDLRNMKASINKMYWDSDSTVTYPQTYSNPKKVAIVFNGETVSAGEMFLEYARASKKVTFFGQPSKGGIDNLDRYTRNFGCIYELGYPTTRNGNYKGPDTYGSKNQIHPDVLIPKDTSDWIAFVINYYKNHR